MLPSILQVNLLQLAANYSYSSYISSIAPVNTVQLISYSSKFVDLIGPKFTAKLVDQRDYEFVHEAGVYLSSTDSIYVASQATSLENPINITVIDAKTYKATSEVRYAGQVLPNGGTAYNSTHILFCNFGDLTRPSTLSLLDPSTNKSSVLLSSFYGRNFSSINDVRINHLDHSIWFTDSTYGRLEGFRPLPVIPSQVYRFEPSTGIVTAVADGFVEPNGIEFSPDFKTVYVSDTGYVLAPGDFNGTRPSSIYAFDVTSAGTLANRRLFAYSGHPFPDGVHADKKGNVWSSSGNGTSVWDERGVLLGEVRTETGVNNFIFVPEGILLFAFTKLWLVTCDVRGRTFG